MVEQRGEGVPADGVVEAGDAILAGARLGRFQRPFGSLIHLPHRHAGLGHGQAGAEMDLRVAGDVFGEFPAHVAGQPLGTEPGADQEEVVAAGEDGVGGGMVLAGEPWQPDSEEVVHLPREGGHLGEGGARQSALEDQAQVVHVALEGGQGADAEPFAPFVQLAVVAGDELEGLELAGIAAVHRFVEVLVAVLLPLVELTEQRHITVDVAPGVAAKQRRCFVRRQAVVPGAQQLAVPRQSAEAAAALFVGDEADVIAEQGQFQRDVARQRFTGDQHPLFVGELLADGNLIGGQIADRDLAILQPVAGGGTAIDRADAEGVVEIVEKAVEHRCRRGITAESEAARLGVAQGVEQAVDQLLEARILPRFAMIEKVVAAGRGPGNADPGLPIAPLQKPGIETPLQLLQGLAGRLGVGGNDQELTGGVDDLAGGWQVERVEDRQGGALSQQGNVERSAPQQPGGALLGFATGGEEELLDAEEVTLDQQQLLLVPVGAGEVGQPLANLLRVVAPVVVVAPQGGGQGSGGAAVVIERNLGASTKGGRRRDRLGVTGPEGIEMVQPQGPIAAVAGRNLLQSFGEGPPESSVFGLRGLVVVGFVSLCRHREQRLY